MKMLLAAIALTIASPALAQTPAPADAHANHAAHAPKSAPATHADHAGHAQHAAPAADGAHAGHKMPGGCCDKMADGKMMPCCEKMKATGKKMDCCDKAASKAPTADPHAGHDMSKH